jgi:hypothetical protein
LRETTGTSFQPSLTLKMVAILSRLLSTKARSNACNFTVVSPFFL